MAETKDLFETIKECEYKGERYSVREDGAVMRHQRKDGKVRPLDNKWTFGKKNLHNGYMHLGSARVHIIVATAFYGDHDTTQYVVDHKDTNRCNNRPENLRWLTKLENVLNNPITRARIENICGIEAFIANPSILRGYESHDPNFSWMRTVTPEEARISYERLLSWSKEHPKPVGGVLGDWIFQEPRTTSSPSSRGIYPSPNVQNAEPELQPEPEKVQSLTPNAVQLDWHNPVEFPCCPLEPQEDPLKEYMSNLAPGKIFSTNKLGDSTVLDFGMHNEKELWVMCSIRIGWKTHAFTKIFYEDGIYYHENMGVFDLGDEPEELFTSIINNRD